MGGLAAAQQQRFGVKRYVNWLVALGQTHSLGVAQPLTNQILRAACQEPARESRSCCRERV